MPWNGAQGGRIPTWYVLFLIHILNRGYTMKTYQITKQRQFLKCLVITSKGVYSLRDISNALDADGSKFSNNEKGTSDLALSILADLRGESRSVVNSGNKWLVCPQCRGDSVNCSCCHSTGGWSFPSFARGHYIELKNDFLLNLQDEGLSITRIEIMEWWARKVFEQTGYEPKQSADRN